MGKIARVLDKLVEAVLPGWGKLGREKDAEEIAKERAEYERLAKENPVEPND